MRVLFTGASSVTGGRVLQQMLKTPDYSDIWCARHQSETIVADPRVHLIDLDLESNFTLQEMPAPIDMVIHFAGVTHSRDPERYWRVNLQGTIRLAEAARALGCRRFIFVSTRCATAGSGAYGESKLAAEEELKEFQWDNLLIIRPSEIYGGGGKEGIDSLLNLARRWHVAPMLCGDRRIHFAPLHIDDFAWLANSMISKCQTGVFELRGPEDLDGVQLARRLAWHFFAMPVPLWWPAFKVLLKGAQRLGIHFVEPDQIQRLICQKTCSGATEVGTTRFLRDKVD